MGDLRGFDANQVEPSGSFEAIPEGTYTAVIIDSDWKPTKAGSGQYLQLTFQITEGEYKNRLVWSRLNLKNSNDMAVKIAMADLSAICLAVGLPQPDASSDLHDLPLLITVKCKKRQDTGEIVNEIKKYSKNESPGTAETAVAMENGTPPWQRS